MILDEERKKFTKPLIEVAIYKEKGVKETWKLKSLRTENARMYLEYELEKVEEYKYGWD